jgi:hypothetical protein
MCQFGTSEESFQNHHLAGTRVTIKLASGQLALLARYKTQVTLQISKKPDLTLRILTGGSNFVKIMGIGP